jgi:hypothetical protein
VRCRNNNTTTTTNNDNNNNNNITSKPAPCEEEGEWAVQFNTMVFLPPKR